MYKAYDGQEGLQQIYSHQPDLIILDIITPNLDGWQVCRRTGEMSDVPIIILTTKGKEEDIGPSWWRTRADPSPTANCWSKSSANSLLAIVSDILEFSEIEAGQVSLGEKDFDPWATVERAVEMMAPHARKKGLDLSSQISPQVPRALVGDPRRLRQVLGNLTALLRPGGLSAGDVKLATLIGLILGFPQVLWALALGILAGGIAAVLLILTRRGGLKSYIPYAPFLCVEAIVALLYNPLPLIFPLFR